MTDLSASIAMRVLGCLFLLGGAAPAHAWGDEGHEVIGLIAEHYLEPAVRKRVEAILAGDRSGLTSSTRIDQEATWADSFRDSDRTGTRVRYEGTRDWHFVDLEVRSADLREACHGEPSLPSGTPASNGPARDCIVDKIEEFRAELRNPATSAQERLLALQFLLHLIGDVHQPLHASDDHDQGGNRKRVRGPGLRANNLHHVWDVELVRRLGPDQAAIAQRLISAISEAQRARWSSGRAADWAWESFAVARKHAYGLLPATASRGHYNVSAAYVADATAVTAQQLSEAGVRLAYVLNQTMR